MEEYRSRRRAGEVIDRAEELRRISRFAERNLALDEWGVLADLYLDSALVGEDEVEEIVAGVCDPLEHIDVGPHGGELVVYRTEKIISYTSTP